MAEALSDLGAFRVREEAATLDEYKVGCKLDHNLLVERFSGREKIVFEMDRAVTPISLLPFLLRMQLWSPPSFVSPPCVPTLPPVPH